MVLKLEKWIGKTNIIDAFTDDQLNRLGAQVVDDWQIDLISRAPWETATQDGLDLAMQIASPGGEWGADIKYPLIAYAAIQFHARAYPEIIKGNEVVKAKVTGRDEDGQKQERADRISKHMSWQVLEEMTEWEEDTDRLLMMLPIIGTLFKKTYFCPTRRRNVSCLRKPLDIVVHNDAKSIEDARRITDQGIWLYRNDIHERKADDVFVDEIINYEFDEDQQKAEQFLEQHLWYDLDDDGYQEPYIITVHRHSSKVVRVFPCYDADSIYMSAAGKLARIEPTQYFTKFSFLPSFDGSFYDIGFGQLLCPLNEAINTNLNQLIDAGTISNLQGGLISRGIKIKGGTYSFKPGEWKQTDASPQDLKDGFYPLPVNEPSQVLFNLLSFLVDTGKMLSSVADIMSGEAAGPNEPVGTMLTRVEQGMKVFNGIHKRIYRSLKSEFKKLAKLNKDYMDDEYYFRVLDIENVAIRADYNNKDLDIVPVADPGQGTDVQRMAKAQALMPLKGQPGINNWAIDRRYLESIKIDNINEIQPEEGKDKPPQQPPDPKLIELEMKQAEAQQNAKIKVDKQFHEITLIDAQAGAEKALEILRLAQAEAAELGPTLEHYKQFATQLTEENARLKQPQIPEEVANVDQGNVPRLENPIDDGGGIQGGQELPPDMGGEVAPEAFDGGDIQGGGDQGGGIAGA